MTASRGEREPHFTGKSGGTLKEVTLPGDLNDKEELAILNTGRRAFLLEFKSPQVGKNLVHSLQTGGQWLEPCTFLSVIICFPGQGARDEGEATISGQERALLGGGRGVCRAALGSFGAMAPALGKARVILHIKASMAASFHSRILRGQQNSCL